VLGLDIGGSATKAVVIERGHVVERRQTAGRNALLDTDVAEHIVSLVREAAPDCVGVGLAGASDEVAALALGRSIGAQCHLPVRVATDITVAWLGSFLGQAGIVVAAGTGSFAVGGHDLRSLRRAGGHGFLLADEGGAYWLGREALRAALAERDGTGPATVLGLLIERQTGCDRAEMVRLVHQAPTDRSILASLAPLVAQAAGPGPAGEGATGDGEARAILERAASALASMVNALQLQLGPLPVAPVGGVLGGPVGAYLRRLVSLQAPAADAAVGAALLAVDRF
jgi:N-acetylglucosamine kinase-like BadF-type ATPase